MGRRGPLPQPDNVRELRGNPGKRRSSPGKTPVIETPNPPTWLKDEALAEWRRTTPELKKLGRLAKMDRAILATYCTWWAYMVQLRAQLAATGTLVKGRHQGEVVKSPLWQQHRDATKMVLVLARECRLTPDARLRHATVPPDSADVDELERILT
jgi:P27 family predicted phage terminase small subunit